MEIDRFHLGVKALIRNEEGKFLVFRVNLADHVRYDGPEYYDLPGGRINRGESVEDALRREIEEETGITSCSGFTPFMMCLSKQRIPLHEGGDVGLILSIFTCDALDASDIKISDEHSGYGWYSAVEAAELLSTKFPSEFTEKLAMQG